jgi:hypothetical protein
MSNVVEDIVDEEEEIIYVLGYWNNPYRSNDREYYWFRCYEGMKEARRIGKRKQEHGQPKTFIDWVQGKNSYFTSEAKFLAACAKVGMNPKLD